MVNKFKPTEQQQKVLDVMSGDIEGKVAAVIARAGCTKTSTSKLVVHTLKPKKALYFAFNKAIVEEGKESFSSNVECKTLHALAYKYIRPGSVEDFTYSCIKERLSYPDKLIILNVVDEFFRSGSTDMYDYFEEMMDDREDLARLAGKYVEFMLEDKMPKPFNLLLKQLPLMLDQEMISIDYDLAILDEAGDTTAVAVEIFKLINAPKKMMLGDDLQTIYGFMNLVDGFKLIDDPIHLELTKSFRCCTDIAERTEAYVQENLDKSFVFEGFDREPSDDTTMYISATNSQLVLQMRELLNEGKTFKLLREPKEIFGPLLALITARAGKKVYHKRYRFLEDEYKNYAMSGFKNFFSYLLKEVQDEETHTAIEILNTFANKNINVFELKEQVEAINGSDDIILCTGYTSKGLESDRVVILNDLNRKIAKIMEKGGPEDDNDYTTLKLGYVAMTRARFHLDNCKYA